MTQIQSPVRRFVRHYVEMVVVMLLGMIVLGLPAEGVLQLAGSGSDELERSAPAVLFLGMAATMTVPMVAWMRHHGHAWRPCSEMAASMVVPTLVAILLLEAGVAGFHALMGLEHAVMLIAMLAVMLARFDEYAGPHHAHGAH